MSVRFQSANTEGLTRVASVFDQNADFTWSAWWYMPTTVGNGAFFFYAGADGSPYGNMDSGSIIGTELRVQAKDASGNDIVLDDGATALSAGTWYYVTLQRTGTTLRMYLRPGSGSVAAGPSGAAALTGRIQAARMSLGLRNDNDRPNDTRVAYARLHASVLSTAEIEAEATSPTAVVTTNLWGDWPLTVHTDLTDVSGNGRDWSAVGTLSTEDDPPDVVVGGGSATVTPNAGALTATGQAPTLLLPRVMRPAAGAVSATGFAPTVLTPRTIAAGVGAVTVTGFAPTILSGTTVSPAAGDLTATGLAPTIVTPQSVRPATGTITVTAFAPTVLTPRVVRPALGTATLTGLAPSVVLPKVVRPTAGAATLTGLAPTFAATGNALVRAQLASLLFAGYAPVIATTSDEAARAGKYAAEHADAFRALGAATGFGADHASAFRALGDA